MSRRNIWLDLFKIFLCFLVICIHYVRQKYTHFPLYRLAVPTFFILSGFFTYNKDNNEKSAFSFIKRSLIYMAIGMFTYFVFDFINTIRFKESLSDFFKSQIYDDFARKFLFYNYSLSKSANHLWYLIAAFVVSLIHFILIKMKLVKVYPFIIVFCLFIHLFYSGYLPFNKTSISIYYIRNGIFLGLPLFGIGFLIARFNFHKKIWYKYIYISLAIIFFFLQILDARGL